VAHLVETMAYAGDIPWHGLGVKIPDNLNPEEILKYAGLDWRVKVTPLYYKNDKGELCDAGDKALLRESDGYRLDNVSGDWHPLQNEDAFSIFEDVVKAGDMEMHTAGSLDHGRIVWALAKIKQGFTVGKKDRVDSYLLLTNPHKYGKTIDGCYTGIRVVCNNTLRAAYAGATFDLRKHHRKAFNVEEAKALLGVSTKSMERYKEAAQFLATKRYDNRALGEYFINVFPSTAKNGNGADNDNSKKVVTLSKPAVQAIGLVESQPGAELARGTWWNAFNAVTYLTDHTLGNSPDTRLKSAWYGPNRDRKAKALDLAVDYAQAA
jgi:phage/plasmid-like protein (TIGR03299 family)